MNKLSGIIWTEETESTNKDAATRIDSLDNMAVLATAFQTSGRGQGNHTWTSARGENLTFTLVLKYPPVHMIAPSDILLITESITHALINYLATIGIDARIKWPNDIYVGANKISGILINNIIDNGTVSASIIGVGLNLNQTDFPEELPNPISAKIITGRQYDVKSEMESVYEEIKKSVLLLDSDEGRTVLDAFFRSRLFKLDGDSR